MHLVVHPVLQSVRWKIEILCMTNSFKICLLLKLKTSQTFQSFERRKIVKWLEIVTTAKNVKMVSYHSYVPWNLQKLHIFYLQNQTFTVTPQIKTFIFLKIVKFHKHEPVYIWNSLTLLECYFENSFIPFVQDTSALLFCFVSCNILSAHQVCSMIAGICAKCFALFNTFCNKKKCHLHTHTKCNAKFKFKFSVVEKNTNTW